MKNENTERRNRAHQAVVVIGCLLMCVVFAQAQTLINATGDTNPNNTYKAIMHRSINGFLAWQDARETCNASDFRDVLRLLQKAGST
jgi:hypothetical protein